MFGLISLIGKITLWLKKDGAAIFGLLNLLVKAARELIVTAIRLIALVLPDAFVEDTIIIKISGIFDTIEEKIEDITNWLLGLV